MWRRYRFMLLLAIVVGTCFGLLLAVGVYLSGNADYRSQGGWAAFLRIVSVGVLFGGATAIGASLGALVALILGDRPLAKPARFRVRCGGAGAALGAATLWLCFGILNGLMTESGWQWFGLTAIFIAVAAPVAAIGAGILITRAEKFAGERSTQDNFVSRSHVR